MSSYGKSQTNVHAARIILDRLIQKVFHSTEGDDLIQTLLNLSSVHSQKTAVQKDIVPTAQVRMKARTHLQERRHATVQTDLPPAGQGDAGKDLEQGGFTGSVAAHNSQRLSLFETEVESIEGGKGFGRWPSKKFFEKEIRATARLWVVLTQSLHLYRISIGHQSPSVHFRSSLANFRAPLTARSKATAALHNTRECNSNPSNNR